MVRAKAAALRHRCARQPDDGDPGHRQCRGSDLCWARRRTRASNYCRRPLSLHSIQLRCVSSILEKLPAPVPFEQVSYARPGNRFGPQSGLPIRAGDTQLPAFGWSEGADYTRGQATSGSSIGNFTSCTVRT